MHIIPPYLEVRGKEKPNTRSACKMSCGERERERRDTCRSGVRSCVDKTPFAFAWMMGLLCPPMQQPA